MKETNYGILDTESQNVRIEELILEIVKEIKENQERNNLAHGREIELLEKINQHLLLILEDSNII